jgi:hypothetical protein
MIRQEQLLLIARRCVEANPTIKKLNPGCRVRTGQKRKYGANPIWKEGVVVALKYRPATSFVESVGVIFDGQTVTSWLNSEELAPLGRPIRLADVLSAMH